jgi:hypothetical protein
MKKVILAVLATLFLVTSSYAYNAYFTVEGTNLGELNGFQFTTSVDPGTLTLDIVYQNEPNVIGLPGAVPEALAATFPWDITKTGSGAFGFDNSYGASPLSAGVVLALTGPSTFSLTDFVFARNAGDGGAFDLPFDLSESPITDGAVYAFSSPPAAVPLPPAILLLGGGLVGLVGLRRKVRS